MLENKQHLWGQWGELLKHLVEQLTKEDKLTDFLLEGSLWGLPSPLVNGILAFVAPDSLVESTPLPESDLGFQKHVGNVQSNFERWLSAQPASD